MDVRLLQFTDRSALSRAFAWVVECGEVGGCVIEAEERSLRFQATRVVADRLVERIYADGGLVWCSRHEIRWLEGRCGVIREPDGPRAAHR